MINYNSQWHSPIYSDDQWHYEWKALPVKNDAGEDVGYPAGHLANLKILGWEEVPDGEAPPEMGDIRLHQGLVLMRCKAIRARAHHGDQAARRKLQLEGAMLPFKEMTAAAGFEPFGRVIYSGAEEDEIAFGPAEIKFEDK